MKRKLLFFISIAICTVVYAKTPEEFKNFPKGSDPGFIGQKVAQRYIDRYIPHAENKRPIIYPETCTWFGALRFAKLTNDQEMFKKLEDHFFPMFGKRKNLIPKPDHVDNTVFGIVPLQLYLQTGNPAFYHVGMDIADRQWEIPSDVNPANRPKYEALAARGLTWQTRFWIDDMYMITSVQSQAYLASKDEKYINRTAYEMTVYLDSIQQPNGLFLHEKTAPFFWSRGNGWMAAGMTDLLTYLPENNPDRPRILQAYRQMMATLKSYQNREGLWNQLIDNPASWAETSGTAMFTYAMITGVKNGWLDAKVYAPVARKAWLALLTYLNENWDLRDVCEGTNIGFTTEYYLNRKRNVGDLHGQAALLWCAVALYDTDK